MTLKKIAILGSTGSIGESTLDVVRRHPQKFAIVALAAGKRVDLLEKQILEFQPQLASVADEKLALELQTKLRGKVKTEILFGEEGSVAVAKIISADIVVSAIVGAAGLKPTLAAIEAGKNIALANKETLVVAGKLVMNAVKKHGVTLLPVDSEHSAIFQSLVGQRHEDIDHIILTASGGPFRKKTLDELKKVTVADALKHPNWNMGSKITIDSASMMNKGLEVIEARWLFDLPAEKIKVLIHPQSIVHSMVAYRDGSVISQLGLPDMRTPIAYALTYPERIESGVQVPNFAELKELSFEKPDLTKFRCLQLAYDALQTGGSAPCVLNAANEICVSAFLQEKIHFLDISRIIEQVLAKHQVQDFSNLDQVLACDAWVRKATEELI